MAESQLGGADETACVAANELFAQPLAGAGRPRFGETLGSGNSVLDLVAGDFAWQIARIFGPNLSPYLTATDKRRHIWHSCLAAPHDSFWTEPGEDVAVLRRRLLEAKGQDLIAESYGVCPPGLERALGKLGTTARRRPVYAALVAALGRDDAGAKLLRHASELPDTMVLAVAELPARVCTKSRIAALRDVIDIEIGLPFFAWAMERLGSLAGVDVTEAMRRTKKPMLLLRTTLETLPFPPPPWPGDAVLVPLTSREQLRAAGTRLRNCLREASIEADAVRGVVRGQVYYYEWHGTEPALLSFQSVPPLGWALEQACGVDNTPLSHRTQEEVVGRLTEVEHFCPREGGPGFWNYHMV